MLFTDGTILTIEDLREHDNFILEIASTESIELGSKLATAQRLTGYELASFLAARESGIRLGRVVVNDELRDLLAMQTLAAIYRDAYNRHLNDRYLGRWKEFSQASERSMRLFLQNGIGIASAAVPRAEKPLVSITDSGGLEAGFYSIQITWQHLTGTVGEKSPSTQIDLAGGGMLITPASTPHNMMAWHVFVSIPGTPPARQNQRPIAAGTSWTQAAALRFDLLGPEASEPDFYLRSSNSLVRR